MVVIHGETGSGKTTQIPQYLFELGINQDKIIGVTQPRRIGAIRMAKRVAEETCCAIGKEVGYEIRFENKSGASTKIKYMTDGILLNQCITDRNLSEYSIIMVDEAHERALRSDVLLGLLKSIVSRNTDLKIIITSATMDAIKFSRYFFDAPIIKIEGRSFDVEVLYNPSYSLDCISASVVKIEDIHVGIEKGDILVFLTGQEEIEKCVESLAGIENLVVLPLFSAMEYHDQQRVFEKVKDNERKVIIATNIAETSITIDGIRFIIDCGYVKQSNFNPQLGMDVWEDVRISKAQADQRKGRAGRTNTGWCYRLYGEGEYNNFLNEERPEIMRKNLSEIYLKVVAFGLDPKTFNFIDPPNIDALLKSEKELKDLNLIDSRGRLTDDGRLMEDFPVEPILGKIILSSVQNKCAGNMLIILAMMTERNIFKRPRARAKQSDEKKTRFHDIDGDPFTLLKVYKEWIENSKSESWCKDNFVDSKNMANVFLVQEQLSLILKRRGIPTEPTASVNKDDIRKSIFSGYFRNLCVKGNRNTYTRCIDNEILYIHPSSSLFLNSPKQ